MTHTRSWIPAALFWTTALVLLAGNLGVYGLWGSEHRWTEIVREMRLSGDYFHPTLGGESYFDKPLLSYWLIAACAALSGRWDELTIRLPSVLAALASLAATISLARHLVTERQARTAGWLLLCTYGLLTWARTAEADMLNLAAIILAVAWYWARRERFDFLGYAVFYAICFVGAQAKGMAAIAIPPLVILPDLIRERRWKTHLSLSHLLGLAVGVALYTLPMIWADTNSGEQHESGLSEAFRENVVRYFQPYDHKEPFYVYFIYVPFLAAPLFVLALAAIWHGLRTYKAAEWSARWLTLSVVLIFVFFTLSGSRRLYYILPLLPFLAILTARLFEMGGDGALNRWAHRVQIGFLVLFALFGVASPAVWPLGRDEFGFEPTRELQVVTFLLGALAFVPFVVARLGPGRASGLFGTERKLGLAIAMAAITFGGYFVIQRPILQEYRTIRAFGQEVERLTVDLPAGRFAFYGAKGPADVRFYVDRPVLAPVLDDAPGLAAFLGTGSERRVLVTRLIERDQMLADLPAGVRGELLVKEQLSPWEDEEVELWKMEAWTFPAED